MTNQKKVPALLIAKITLKAICGVIEKPTEPTEIARIVGFASASEDVITAYGISKRLKGLFRAINLGTGETYESSVLFLPDLAAQQVATALLAGAPQVELAFDVVVVPTFKLEGSGYQFQIRPLFAPTVSSPLDKLMLLVEKGHTKEAELLVAPVVGEAVPKKIGKR